MTAPVHSLAECLFGGLTAVGKAAVEAVGLEVEVVAMLCFRLLWQVGLV